MARIKKVTAATLKKRNAAFKKMSQVEKKIAIAKDVIALIKAEVLNAEKGYKYETFYKEMIEYTPDSQVQSVLNDRIETVKCDVCAIGAVALAKIRIGNDCTKEDLGANESDNLIDNVSDIFDEAEMRLMEVMFESVGMTDEAEEMVEEVYGDDTLWQAEAFHQSYKDDNARLIAIMQNIIDNEGEIKLD